MNSPLKLKYGLPPFFIGLYAFAGASAQQMALIPLRSLGIPYPWVLDYWSFVVPGVCVLLWLTTVRWWPVLGGITSVIMCGISVGVIYFLAEAAIDAQVARIPVTSWLPREEQQTLDAIPIRIHQRYSKERGAEVLVAPEDEKRVREVIERLGILRESRGPPPR